MSIDDFDEPAWVKRKPRMTKQRAKMNNANAAMAGYIIAHKGEIPAFKTVPIPTRKASVPSNQVPEHDHQHEVITWWDSVYEAWGYPRNALYAVPNQQSLIQFANNKFAFMAYLRQEGFRDGALDLNLDIASKGFHGLRLEMKKLTGTPSTDQVSFVAMFHKLGYAAGFHYGAASAISAIRHYLGR